MTRILYGASAADYMIDPVTGLPAPGELLDIYTAISGGTHLTDLQAWPSATPISQVTTDSLGGYRFLAPDGYKGPLWASNGTDRYLVLPVDLVDRVVALEILVPANANAAAADAADAAAAGQAALDRANQSPIVLYRNRATGAWPARPATSQPVDWRNPLDDANLPAGAVAGLDWYFGPMP